MTDPRYKYWTIPKKDGKARKIAEPNYPLKQKQKKLLRQMEDLDRELNLVSNLAHGFVKGRSALTNAKPHLGKRYMVNLDIKDFFPSVTAVKIKTNPVYMALFKPLVERGMTPTMKKMGWKEVPDLPIFMHEAIERVVFKGPRTTDCHLPQGAPTSPFISNALMNEFDVRLAWVLRSFVSDDIVYTRYADDITISSNSKAINKAYEIAVKELKCMGFEINESKTRFMTPGNRKEVTGYILNSGKLTISKTYRRKVRAIVHRAGRCRWMITKKQFNSVMGMIAHIGTAHPEEAAKYRKQMKGARIIDRDPSRIVGRKVSMPERNGKPKVKATKNAQHKNGHQGKGPTISRLIRL